MFSIHLHHYFQFIKNHKADLCILLIFIITLSLRVCAIHNKTTIFFDDTASFLVSTPNNVLDNGQKFKYSWADLRFKYGHDYTAYEIKKALFESKSGIQNIWKDLVTLHNKTLDRQHSNLYYSILRIWTAGMDISSPKRMILTGCYLNLIFFTLSFFFMYQLLKYIKPDKKFIALGLFFAYITTGSISNSLLIRPYPMWECFFILTLYQFLSLYNSVSVQNRFPVWKMLLYTLGFALFLLSGYFSLLFIAFISIIMIIRCIKIKKFNFLLKYLCIIVLALLFVYLFCPLYFENFKDIEHMTETKENSTFSNFLDFHLYGLYLLEFLSKYVFNNIAFYIILLSLGICGIPILQKNNNVKFEKPEWLNLGLIYSMSFVWAYLIAVISPFHEYAAFRYVIVTFPVISLIFALLTYYLRKEWVVILVFITLFSSLVPVTKDITMFNSKYKNYGVVSFFRDFENLNVNKFVIISKENRLRRVVFVDKNWIWPNYAFYMPNSTIVRFEHEEPKPSQLNVDEYLLIKTEDIFLKSRKLEDDDE